MLIASLIFNFILLIFLALSRRRTGHQRFELKENSIRFNDVGNRLVLALEGADLGLWEWDMIEGGILVNLRGMEMLGYQKHEIGPKMEHWLRLLHPEDVDLRNEALSRYLSGEAERYECEYRLRHKQGHWVWVLDRAKVFSHEADRAATRMVGTFLDISAQGNGARATGAGRYRSAHGLAQPSSVYGKVAAGMVAQ